MHASRPFSRDWLIASHTVPQRPMAAARLVGICCAALAMLLAPVCVQGQVIDSARVGVKRPPVLVPAGPETNVRAFSFSSADTLGPPISPRRAFLYSFLVPGAGQAKLDRGYAGGMFFLIEVSSLVLVHRSAEDLRVARGFIGDSIPLRYDINATTGLPVLDADGNPSVLEWRASRYDAAFVRTRRLHYEDWLAVVIFNHLFAGADAFVAAQLWDLPTKVAVRQTPFGPLVQATLSFR